jgi:hypothetical protein
MMPKKSSVWPHRRTGRGDNRAAVDAFKFDTGDPNVRGLTGFDRDRVGCGIRHAVAAGCPPPISMPRSSRPRSPGVGSSGGPGTADSACSGESLPRT